MEPLEVKCRVAALVRPVMKGDHERVTSNFSEFITRDYPTKYKISVLLTSQRFFRNRIYNKIKTIKSGGISTGTEVSQKKALEIYEEALESANVYLAHLEMLDSGLTDLGCEIDEETSRLRQILKEYSFE